MIVIIAAFTPSSTNLCLTAWAFAMTTCAKRYALRSAALCIVDLMPEVSRFEAIRPGTRAIAAPIIPKMFV
jgi:hypothetical protein